jgi:glycosyltransferase involved in cell wall biosynthesis
MSSPDPARRVLMVLEATFPPHGGGGAESQVLAIGRRLAERGFGVTVMAPRVPGGPQARHETLHGIEIERIAYPRVRLLGGVVLLARLALRLVARRREYSVIHAHIGHNMAAVSALVGRALGKPVLVKVTGMHEMIGGILDPRPGPAARLRRLAIRRASLVQATSTRIRSLLVERGFDPGRIVLLPNGVDIERYSAASRDPARRSALCGDARLVGIFVGRLAPEKGHETLLEVWARAFAGRPDVKLVFVGDGVLRESLAASARRLGIGEQVVFTGHTDQVAGYLAVADFGLLTSLAEGLSNALLEYMAAGLPVIGSRVSGTEDFVMDGETGWLFEPGSAEELARCLSQAAAQGAGRLRSMGERARAHIVSTASLEAVTRRLLDCYGLGGPRAPGAPP